MTQGFTGKIFEILRDLFGKAKSRVKWNSKIGELFENICGVLQGGTISPTLFNAYIEDMQLYFAGEPGVSIGGLNINHLLQANDLILISETSSGLQRLLDKLSKYCRRWHLLLNVIKTKIMIFDNKYLATQTMSNFTFNDKRIDECTKHKYLGVIFSSQGPRFEENNTYVKDKSTRTIIASKTMVHSAVGNVLPTMLLLKIFNQQIRPILEYAADIWYQTDRDSWTRAKTIHKKCPACSLEYSGPGSIRRNGVFPAAHEASRPTRKSVVTSLKNARWSALKCYL